MKTLAKDVNGTSKTTEGMEHIIDIQKYYSKQNCVKTYGILKQKTENVIELVIDTLKYKMRK